MFQQFSKRIISEVIKSNDKNKEHDNKKKFRNSTSGSKKHSLINNMLNSNTNSNNNTNNNNNNNSNDLSATNDSSNKKNTMNNLESNHSNNTNNNISLQFKENLNSNKDISTNNRISNNNNNSNQNSSNTNDDINPLIIALNNHGLDGDKWSQIFKDKIGINSHNCLEYLNPQDLDHITDEYKNSSSYIKRRLDVLFKNTDEMKTEEKREKENRVLIEQVLHKQGLNGKKWAKILKDKLSLNNINGLSFLKPCYLYKIRKEYDEASELDREILDDFFNLNKKNVMRRNRNTDLSEVIRINSNNNSNDKEKDRDKEKSLTIDKQVNSSNLIENDSNTNTTKDNIKSTTNNIFQSNSTEGNQFQKLNTKAKSQNSNIDTNIETNKRSKNSITSKVNESNNNNKNDSNNDSTPESITTTHKLITQYKQTSDYYEKKDLLSKIGAELKINPANLNHISHSLDNNQEIVSSLNSIIIDINKSKKTHRKNILSVKELLSQADGGGLLQGVLYNNRNLSIMLRRRDKLISIPDDSSLFGSTSSDVIREVVCRSLTEYTNYFELIKKNGKSFSNNGSGEYLGLPVSKALFDNSNSNKESSVEYTNKKDYFYSIIRFNYSPLSATFFTPESVFLSSIALKALREIEESYSNPSIVEILCVEFFERFGTHCYLGPFELGGTFILSSTVNYSSQEQNNEASELASKKLQFGLSLGVFGIGVSTNSSKEDSNEKKTKNYDKSLLENSKLTLTKHGGPMECSNLDSWKYCLSEFNSTWTVISYGENKCSVWSLVLKNHYEDFENSEKLAKALASAYYNKLMCDFDLNIKEVNQKYSNKNNTNNTNTHNTNTNNNIPNNNYKDTQEKEFKILNTNITPSSTLNSKKTQPKANTNTNQNNNTSYTNNTINTNNIKEPDNKSSQYKIKNNNLIFTNTYSSTFSLTHNSNSNNNVIITNYLNYITSQIEVINETNHTDFKLIVNNFISILVKIRKNLLQKTKNLDAWIHFLSKTQMKKFLLRLVKETTASDLDKESVDYVLILFNNLPFNFKGDETDVIENYVSGLGK